MKGLSRRPHQQLRSNLHMFTIPLPLLMEYMSPLPPLLALLFIHQVHKLSA